MAARRFYIRCLDCLAVSCVEESPDAQSILEYGRKDRPVCGICGGPLRFMGWVQGKHLYHEKTECVCDERCATATGPNCTCRCGGVNHGVGMMAFITKAVDDGQAPRLTAADQQTAAKYLARALEFRNALEAAETRLMNSSAYQERKRGAWLGYEGYNWLRIQSDRLAKAKASKQHKARMELLASVAA